MLWVGGANKVRAAPLLRTQRGRYADVLGKRAAHTGRQAVISYEKSRDSVVARCDTWNETTRNCLDCYLLGRWSTGPVGDGSVKVASCEHAVSATVALSAVSVSGQATQQPMVVPRHRLSAVGRRAFAVHGPMVWNSLPDDIRAQHDYESFRQDLKTWLFSRY